MYEADGSIIIDTEIQTDGMVPGTQEVEQAIRSMADSVKKIGTDAQMSLQKQINTVSRLNSQYAQQEKKIESIKKKMETLAGKQVETPEYQKMNEELRELEAQFESVERKETEWRQMGLPVDSAGYQELEKQLDDIYFQMEKVQQKQVQMRTNGTAYVDQTSTQEYVSLTNQLAAAEGRLSDMNNRLGTTYTSLKQSISNANPAAAQMRQIISSSASPIQKVSGILGILKSQLLGTDSAQKKVTKSNKKMNQGLRQTSKNANRSRMSMGRMMSGALMISLAMRAVMTVMEGFGEGMNNLVKYSDSGNKAMSALMSAMTQLKNSFATAFAPLIEYVQPALTQFINLLSQAVTWTAQLLAALTGKDTFVKAVKVQQDYADSIKDTVKETKKAIAPFDELIQITMSGTEKNELKPEDMFTTEEVTNELKTQAEDIKKTFGKIFEPVKDSWDKHGNYAVQASKAAFNSLKQLAKDIGASFIQVWNDEGYGEKVSSDLIITFGNLALTVKNLADRFDEAWVKADTGTSIIRHLGDLLLIISGFFREASEAIRDWAAELDFGPLLTSFDNVLAKMNPVVKLIGDALLWLLKNALLPIAKWAIECALPAVLDLIAAGFEVFASVLEALEPLAMWLWNDFLQPFGKWAGEVVIGAIKKVVEWLYNFSNWIQEHQGNVENITLAVLGFFSAWKITEFLSNVGAMIGKIGGLMGVLDKLNLKFAAIVTVIGMIISLALLMSNAWDKMTPGEKIVSSLLAVAGALALVVALVSYQLKDMAGVLIAGSIAAIAGISIAGISSSANKRNSPSSITSGHGGGGTSFSTRSIAASRYTYHVPALANGTVVPARAGEFLAMLGDNRKEPEVVSPMSTIEQAVENVMDRRGWSDNRPLQVDMYLDKQRLGRVVYELSNQEKQRVGVRLVTEG
jgi:hypothetical protein